MGLDNGNIENKKDGCEGLRESFLPYFINRVNNGIQVPADLRFCPTSDTNLRPIDGLKEEWNLFMDFIDQSHFICHTMLQSISDAIGLRGRERLEVSHDQNSPSTSAAVLQHYPLQGLPPNTSAGHFAHTDSGSISVLFCSDWGLQVYSSQDSQWEWVQPRENHAVVNVGDALKFISGCKLTSSLHRVVPRHMFWVSEPRYSAIFFLRPNNDAEFTDNEGNHWTGSRWLNRKFGNYRKPHSEQMMNSLATGRFGFVGLLSSTKGVSSHV
jgi:isopenicillin N synthase-like dioxygenase